MNGAELLDRWANWYPGTPPLGYRLREAFPERWFRIHSLPESQRYATSEAEYEELLGRHNAVATDLLGSGAPCAVLVTTTCDPEWTRDLDEIAGLGPGTWSLWGRTPVDQVDPDLREDEPEGWCVFGLALRWAPGRLDSLIRSVAEDRLRAIVVSQESGRVYAPYDGGADLFLAGERERDEMRDRYRAWLSTHPYGL